MTIRLTSIHLALAVVLTAALLYAGKPDPCSVRVSPQVGIAPLSYLRVVTTIDPRPEWRSADITLYDDVSELTSSIVFSPDSVIHAGRTHTTEWKSLNLDAGQYYVHLRVFGISGTRCDAKVTLDVH